MKTYFGERSPEITQREIEHMALSRKIAGDCIVLLENDGTLPLKAGGSLALFGNGGRDTVKGGTGSGDVNTRSSVSVEEGLAQAGYDVTTTGWLARQEQTRVTAKKEYLEWVARTAKETSTSELGVVFSHPFQEPAPIEITEEDISSSRADTAVYVLARNSGEGSDRYNRRGDYLLYEEEKAQLEKLAAVYDKLILVLNIGGVMDMSEVKAIPGINAVVLMTQLGNIGGQALADVLTGKVTPSGKLTDTWAKKYTDYPSSESFSHNDGNVDDEYYTEGIYVGYRYFDTFGVEPVYCFGYGKSYTDFEIKAGEVSVKDGKVTVPVCVKNTGAEYAGKEIVQVYVSAPRTGIAKPYQELAGFGKTRVLAPGETETLAVTFAVKDMASYDESAAAWKLDAGNYTIRVGADSRHTTEAAVLTLDQTVTTEHLRNLFGSGEQVKEMAPPAFGTAGSDQAEKNQTEIRTEDPISRIRLDASRITAATASYQGERQPYTTDHTEMLTMDDIKSGRCTVEELVSQLTIEELAELCVGTLRADGGSVVGSASSLVPGAAADTSAVAAQSRGIQNMILADGPAGLRLQPVFKTTKDGELLPGGTILADVYEPFDPDLNEDEVDTYYQYCTAIPIGWALAQSWDPALLEQAGDMVGTEMELFGVDLWLAPALNIHRNPLCGRNFEYYSEDPLISGKIAAAITNGVQKHPGKGTTIKHFAVNSQEDNRYFTNSHVSERALREIYLKGFEIAVKESHPLSIMTSYNLINGIHAANNYDLLQSAARDEWGFEGVVMTDWFTSQYKPEILGGENAIYPISASTGCVHAGNDLQMPGCQKNVDDLVEAVRTGKEIDGYKVTLADLQFNAANVIRIVAKVC